MTVDVEVLVHDHKKAVNTIDGLEFHTVPGLLAQLRDAVYGAGVRDGAGSASKAKLPIQAAALDLLMVIDRQISEVWVQAFKRVPGISRPEALLAEWAAWADDETMVMVAERSVLAADAVDGWVRSVSDYFDPPRLAEISAPCVACGERWTYRTVDGETVRSSALSFRRDRDTGETLDARCESCGNVWTPAQFLFLAEAIGAGANQQNGSE